MDQTGASRIRAFITKYIYVFLILIAGIVLMALPASEKKEVSTNETCLLYTSPSPRDRG